ncbi:MAG: TetR/AcrR family transcriptional regulator [Acidimicrobiales bacterium]
MSSSVAALEAPPGRRLTDRQAEAVSRLVEAAVDEIHDRGYDGLTVRNVARRAGMAPASAYTYFSSKDHLVAEALWRRLHALAPGAAGDTPLERIEAELRALGLFLADDPALSAACTAALLGSGPDVGHLRARIGREIHDRLRRALGPEGPRGALAVLELSTTGAMLSAGMGHISYADVAELLVSAAHLVLGDRT